MIVNMVERLIKMKNTTLKVKQNEDKILDLRWPLLQ